MDRNVQERIASIVEALCGGNRSEFCRRIGRKADAIKDIVGGRGTAPGYDLIYDICASDLGISPTWLILGIGDMLTTPIAQQSTKSPSVTIGSIQTVNIANWGDLVELLRENKNQ